MLAVVGWCSNAARFLDRLKFRKKKNILIALLIEFLIVAMRIDDDDTCAEGDDDGTCAFTFRQGLCIFPRYLGCGCELQLQTKPQRTLLKNLLSIVERDNCCAHVQAAPVCC